MGGEGSPSGALAARRHDDDLDRQVVPHGEVVVALVVGRDAHDRAGAVAGQDVVGDQIGIGSSVSGLTAYAPMNTPVSLALREPLDLGLAPRDRDVGLDLGPPVVGRQLRHERVLRGEDHERGAEHRVRPGREHPDGLDVIGLGPEGHRKSISAPSDRPIQFVCIRRIGSG